MILSAFILFFFYNLNQVNAFFTPQVKTSSGKQLSLTGNGPPILFSTGLYGTMPNFLYSKFINQLKINHTIITLNGFNPITENTIDEVCNAICVDKIGYVGHSSFNPNVLNNNNINYALLIDPINIPTLNTDGFTNSVIELNYPTTIIKAQKLYYGEKSLPDWQNPSFQGKYDEEFYEEVGHPDILDDIWANFAKSLGLWEMIEPNKMEYNDWKLNMKKTVSNKRDSYRKYIAQKVRT